MIQALGVDTETSWHHLAHVATLLRSAPVPAEVRDFCDAAREFFLYSGADVDMRIKTPRAEATYLRVMKACPVAALASPAAAPAAVMTPAQLAEVECESREMTEAAALLTGPTAAARVEVAEPDWHAVDDGAFARPFGTVRKCIDCGCLVAGGPTRCGRCADDVESLAALRKGGES